MAIFTLLDRQGWNEELAERGARYLRLAQAKELRNAKVISASELHQQVARKYGMLVKSLGDEQGASEKTGDQASGHDRRNRNGEAKSPVSD